MLGHNRRMTGAECLADMLNGYGVTHVFMVPAVLRRPSRRWRGAPRSSGIHTHGEKSAAYMADGYARASGKPGICMAQVIGALNLAAGLRDAWLAHSPVIAMTGGRDAKTKFRKVYQEIDDMPAFEPVTKFNATVDDVARFPGHGAAGVPHGDVGHARAGAPAVPRQRRPDRRSTKPSWSRWSRSASRACRRSVRSPTRDSVRAALKLLQQAERPVIVAGGGVRASGRIGEARRARRGAADSGRDLAQRQGFDPRQSSALGRRRRQLFARERQPRRQPRRPRLLHRHRDRRHDHAFLGGAEDRHAGDPDRHRRRSARPQLSAGSRRQRRRQGDARAHARRSRPRQRVAAQDLDRRSAGDLPEWATKYRPLLESDAVPIRPERICGDLTKHMPDDAIVVVDTGHGGMWMGGFYDLTSPHQSYMRSAGHLGWAFPGRPRRQMRVPGPAGGDVHRRRRLLVPHRRNRDRGALEDQRGDGRQQQRQRQPVEARLRPRLRRRADRAAAAHCGPSAR